MSDKRTFIHKGLPDDLLTSQEIDERRLKVSLEKEQNGELTRQELTIKELLEKVLIELCLIRMHQEIITDQTIRPEEIDKCL